uniref:Transmembrane protein 44 n=1 Tax=Aquila chrysaetos chrysaetos TaxID=223781 RepID=A0A663DXW9_AQUCH
MNEPLSAAPVAFCRRQPSCVSWGLWMLAALCWIAARSLLSCECPGQGHRQPSVLCLLYTFLGHICNTVGALLASQLGFQVGKALCGWVGTLPAPCPPSAPVSHAGLPRRRRRRRRLRGGLLALTLPLSVGAGGSLLAPGPWPARGQLRGARRRLLGAVFEVSCPLLGPWLQSRLWVAQCRGKPCQRRRLWATLCSAAASVLYAAAIVTHNQQPVHVLRALPWLLIALGSAALDVVVSFSNSSPRALALLVVADMAHSPLQAVNWAPLNMFPKPRSGPRMVATSHCLDLMIRLVQQVRGCQGSVHPPGLGQDLGRSGMLSPLWQRMGSLWMAVGCMPRFGGGGEWMHLPCCPAQHGEASSLQMLLQCEPRGAVRVPGLLGFGAFPSDVSL